MQSLLKKQTEISPSQAPDKKAQINIESAATNDKYTYGDTGDEETEDRGDGVATYAGAKVEFKKLHEFRRKSFVFEAGEILEIIHNLDERMVLFVQLANRLMDLAMVHRKNSFIFL